MKSGPSIPKIAALICDSRALVRAGIRALVSSVAGQAEFVEAQDVDSVFRGAKRLHPACTKLAFVNPQMIGFESGSLLAEMAFQHPEIRIVAIESFGSPDVIRRVMNIPTVCACVSQDADDLALRSAIRAALEGRRVLPMTETPAITRPISSLTPRQNQVYDLLRRGMSNKLIANALRISESTVKNHVTEILKNLNATNRTQAARFNLNFDHP